jgi:hypothetical protein
MRLLPLDAFAPVCAPLLGKKVGYVTPFGNVGDRLIEAAMCQLFAEFGVRWEHFDPADKPADALDLLVFGGGGNMGTLYENNWRLRGQMQKHGLPIVILPQSFTSPEGRDYDTVFVRETTSLSLCPGGILAPDLALGFDASPAPAPRRRLGVFIRKDQERRVARPWLTSDPAKWCRTPPEYLRLAATYEQIVTDRLHFAICGLIAGRSTTLLANSYHKNEAMHRTWLAGLGCHFATSLEEATAPRRRTA